MLLSSAATQTQDDVESPIRRPYRTPRLRIFGDLAELTQRVGWQGKSSDGGFFFGRNKTR